MRRDGERNRKESAVWFLRGREENGDYSDGEEEREQERATKEAADAKSATRPRE